MSYLILSEQENIFDVTALRELFRYFLRRLLR